MRQTIEGMKKRRPSGSRRLNLPKRVVFSCGGDSRWRNRKIMMMVKAPIGRLM